MYLVRKIRERMEEKMTLLDLQERIKRGIEDAVPSVVWVTAEIGELNNHYSGHCYLDLIDYKQGNRGVVAKARGVIWGSTFRVLKPYFETTAGVPLAKGINVLVKVQVSFSPIYGLALNILDIDPSYTVGELELKRQQTIARLKEEGCMDMNSQLQLPALPRRIAVVSSRTAAGYRDFVKQLQGNEGGFRFTVELFHAQMQGEEAPASVVAALEQIALREDEFDVAVIIRGGGAAMDLVCFDDYNMAVNIAQFPLPVITGIGHDHDFHIADMVAHTWLKTPTAVADFLVEAFASQEQFIMHLFQRISLTLAHKISVERQRLTRLHDRVQRSVVQKIEGERRKLDMLQMRMDAASPAKILGKGFAIVSVGGKRASVGDIVPGSVVKVQLADGTVEFVAGEVKNKIVGKKN